MIRTATLPRRSALWRHVAPGDFHDCRSVSSPFTVQEAAHRALSMPRWAAWAQRLRHGLVGPLGLRRIPAPGVPALGCLPIVSESDSELILGFDDRHLNFRIAVVRDDGRLFLSTWVRPHSLFGRAYLLSVLPLHILIARTALRRMAGHAVAPLPAWA